MAYHVKPDKLGLFRWQLIAANGRLIAESGEGYYNRTDCIHALNLVRTSYNAPIFG